MALKPVGITFVEYEEGDAVGMFLAYISLTPIFIGVAFCSLIMFRRQLRTIAFFLGIILNEGFNYLLKHQIRELRPERGVYSAIAYGMPSSHSQFMGFFCTFLMLFLCLDWEIVLESPVRTRSESPVGTRGSPVRTRAAAEKDSYAWAALHRVLTPSIIRWGTITLVWLIGALVACSRMYLGYHTFAQVFWGIMTGTCTGTMWYGCTESMKVSIFPGIQSSELGMFLLLRGSWEIDDLLRFEYVTALKHMEDKRRKVLMHFGKDL